MFSTPQDLYNTAMDTYKKFPKTPEDVKKVLEKVQAVVNVEAAKAAEVIKVYQKASIGDASINEIAVANKQAQSLAVAARFAALMSIPGAIFMLPALSKIELELDTVDFIPESVRKEFDL